MRKIYQIKLQDQENVVILIELLNNLGPSDVVLNRISRVNRYIDLDVTATADQHFLIQHFLRVMF